MAQAAVSLLALLVMPCLLTGVINRVKSLWSGRRGPPLLQLAFDVQRLMRKSALYSVTTTPVFRVAPYAFLACALGSVAVIPLLGGTPLASFRFDYIWLVYAAALGRVGLTLAALDTGSPFEGMGAARDATFSTILEPVVFLLFGALCLLTSAHTTHEALLLRVHDGASSVAWCASSVALFIALQVEAARMPVDDPTTHLELTMVHEVMVLDHSGAELAAIQLGSAIKLFAGSAMLATLMNPWAGANTLLAGLGNIGGCLAVAIVIGTVESLIARLKIRTVPQYIVVACVAAIIALLASAWQTEGIG